ncbi:MAG TPA: FAD-dependent oxidoreductase [Candidatus Sulfotelmatobacter sp.]|jgi:2-polyprenyl-6-methoxyphenol hydroxylase-like FAD-dependent oxidoreductase|nr:FAD-dependent oxidoreductase [Candidatus Sulfotelmatobacter sp.]
MNDISTNPTRAERTTCCVVGGGPAGVMLGFLLARAGVEVMVLEKHKDFFRDFRGDTIHPSTMELMNELGLLEDFLRQPHQELSQITAHFAGQTIHIGDFSRLPAKCKFIAFMPQWDFLNFLCRHAKKYPSFQLRMEAEVTGLLMENGRVAGVMAATPGGKLEVRADLVVGADGRSSTVRARAELEVIDSGAPIDVLWFRLPKHADDPAQAFGFVGIRQFMVLIDRADYWQCAFVIRKGSFDERKAAGLDAFREEIGRCAPFLSGRIDELKSWDDVKLLSVKVDHLRQWHRDGLLCIGDSAHAMSPVGGVGINLAIQDAVATANLLAQKLLNGQLRETDLQSVQRRREKPARLTQKMQVFMHRHLLERIFDSAQMISPPWPMRLLETFPRLRSLPARMVGIGFRPEHIH